MAWAISQVFLKWTCRFWTPWFAWFCGGFWVNWIANHFRSHLLCPGWQRGGCIMPGVTGKDMHQLESVRGLATFLRKSGKLTVPQWVDTVKLAKHKERARSLQWELILHTSCFHRTEPVPPGALGLAPRPWSLWGASEEWPHAQPLPQRFQECGPSGPPSPAGEMVEKDQDRGCKLTSQEKDLDRIARQVAAGNKQH